MEDLNQLNGSSQVAIPDSGQSQIAPPVQDDGQQAIQPDGQEPVQPQPPEPKPPAFELEPTDPSERSQLGRRVKRMEDEQRAFMQRMDEYMQGLQNHDPQNTPDSEMVISTAADVEKILEKRERAKEKARQSYEQNFLQEVTSLGYENPDIHAEVTREMFEVPNSPFNQIKTGNPTADAHWNYSRALKSVLAKRYANPARPQGQPNRPNAVNVSTGVPIGTRTQTSVPAPIQLDEHASLLVKRLGIPPEKIQKVLGKENK